MDLHPWICLPVWIWGAFWFKRGDALLMTWWVIDTKHGKHYPFQDKDAAISFYLKFMVDNKNNTCWAIMINRPRDYYGWFPWKGIWPMGHTDPRGGQLVREPRRWLHMWWVRRARGRSRWWLLTGRIMVYELLCKECGDVFVSEAPRQMFCDRICAKKYKVLGYIRKLWPSQNIYIHQTDHGGLIITVKTVMPRIMPPVTTVSNAIDHSKTAW